MRKKGAWAPDIFVVPVFTHSFSKITLFEELSRVKITSGVCAFEVSSFDTHFISVMLLVYGKNTCINSLIIRWRVKCVSQEYWTECAGLQQLSCTPSNSSTARLTWKSAMVMPGGFSRLGGLITNLRKFKKILRYFTSICTDFPQKNPKIIES